MTTSESEALKYFTATAQESFEIKKRFIEECASSVIAAARAMAECIRDGGRILLCGNGGSAADAQHTAAEMVGRMLVKDRRPLPAMALTTDTSNLTAIANDFSYDDVFDFQVRALGRKGDVLIAISTSGNSKNVLKAVRSARALGMRVIGVTGGGGGSLARECDFWLNASLGKNASRIQETHIFALHSLVDLLDRFFLDRV